jgi:hypothetical protein
MVWVRVWRDGENKRNDLEHVDIDSDVGDESWDTRTIFRFHHQFMLCPVTLKTAGSSVCDPFSNKSSILFSGIYFPLLSSVIKGATVSLGSNQRHWATCDRAVQTYFPNAARENLEPGHHRRWKWMRLRSTSRSRRSMSEKGYEADAGVDLF